MSAFPRIYRSFAEFERDELRKQGSLNPAVSDLLEERFADDGNLFDDIDDSRKRRVRRRRHP